MKTKHAVIWLIPPRLPVCKYYIAATNEVFVAVNSNPAAWYEIGKILLSPRVIDSINSPPVTEINVKDTRTEGKTSFKKMGTRCMIGGMNE
jgi:hypothetical protein